MSEAAIDEFVRDMNGLLAFEYGDFKRKAGSYLNRLEDRLTPGAPETRKVLSEVRDYIVFRPCYEMDEARARAIADVSRLKR